MVCRPPRSTLIVPLFPYPPCFRSLAALPVSEDLACYAAVGRGVDVLWLDIPAASAYELAQFLAWNALPENAYYHYDYFTDNCSTRVRDALDKALGGALR